MAWITPLKKESPARDPGIRALKNGDTNFSSMDLMKFIGIDAGSVSVKLVELDGDGRFQQSIYRRHRGQPLSVALELLKTVITTQAGSTDSRAYSVSLTGSAGRLMGQVMGIVPVNEVVAFTYATRRLYPHVRTIIELGGEDSKLIFTDEGSDSPADFAMNSVCAAGTGSFLDQQAERLRLSIEEFAELALKSKTPPRIAGRCSVFAKSDMIHLQQIATPVEDIVAGLCFAVAGNFKGSIARGRTLAGPVSFQGGVAANAGMIRAFREVFCLDELFVPEEFAIMGAIGAALKDIGSGRRNSFDISVLEQFLKSGKASEKGHKPLIQEGDGFSLRHISHVEKDGSSGSIRHSPASQEKTEAYLGIDIGSISTNLAVIDEGGILLAKRYLMTAGRPIEAVKQGLSEIGAEIGDNVVIAGVGTTGSGRYMIADFVGADIVKNEITAQATAAAFIDKEVDTIFEIGGQDSKFISLKNGVISDFEMNKACAAGTGSFLEEQAEKLDIQIKKEFAESAFSSCNPCKLGERCTVFMENSLMTNLQRGAAKEDLLAGLAYSIVQNYINRVVGRRAIGKKIFFQGGVAFNKSVVAAFEKYLGRSVTVPPDHDVTGAIGMALIAMRKMKRQETGDVMSLKQQAGHSGETCPSGELPTTFKGFELSKRSHEISSFICNGCPNVCEINRVRIEGEKGHLFYGGRCEKYDVLRRRPAHDQPDLFDFRERLLRKAHERYVDLCAQRNGRNPIKIGIPSVFYFQDFLPFWSTLLWELGFEVELSPRTDKNIIESGLESVLAETCFPVKAASGHIRYLSERKVDAVLLPSFINLNSPGSRYDRGLACPYTQSFPYSAKIAVGKAVYLTPLVDLERGPAFMKKELMRVFSPFGIRRASLAKAVEAAEKAQKEFVSGIRAKGREVLSDLKERQRMAAVIVGRSYNSFDSGINLNIPKKLADLGVTAIPMDFLPLDGPGNETPGDEEPQNQNPDISQEWPDMYWRAGQRILRAARLIRNNPLLYAVYIGSFSCGPDSFILKFFEQEMSGKPYLHLEIDAHSADAGAITRCEAFLDSISHNQRDHTGHEGATSAESRKKQVFRSAVVRPGPRTVFIPHMSDHAYGLAAAFRMCGSEAEVLPEPTSDSVEKGKEYVSGKECYPCAVTTGDMVSKIMEPGFDPGSAAFFMPSGAGPCRFGQYNVFHRMVLEDMGYADIPVFSPNQDKDLYRHLGIVGKDFAMRVWDGVIAIELLTKCLHETRPYEEEKGETDSAYSFYFAEVCNVLQEKKGEVGPILQKARAEFCRIRRTGEKRPLIGIVGEIFVRSNKFSNENLVRKIEALGGEAYLAPVEEWIYYVNAMSLRSLLIKRDRSGIINLLLRRFFQKRIEHRFGRYFEGFLKTLHEPDTKELLTRAGPYLHSSFEGEAVLSIGKSVDLAAGGAAGIVNAMPFGCMPGSIVSGLMRGLNGDFKIPCLSIPFDGTESLTTEIQLEAFMDQAKERSGR